MKPKKRIFAYAILLMACVALMIRLRDAKTTNVMLTVRDYAEIHKEGVLRFITEYSREGLSLTGDSQTGFQYELGCAVADISGLTVQTGVETALPASFAALDNRSCDVVAGHLSITSDLKEKYLFTDPVLTDRQVLVQRTAAANGGKEPIRNQLELSGVTIHAAKGSPAVERLRNMEEELADSINIVEDANYSAELLLFAVAKGEIDYAVCDRRTAMAMKADIPEIDIATDIGFTQLNAWVVRKTSPVLRDSLNAWLRQLKASGKFEEIYNRYYGEAEGND